MKFEKIKLLNPKKRNFRIQNLKTALIFLLLGFYSSLGAVEKPHQDFLTHEVTPSLAFYVGDSFRSFLMGNLNFTQRFSEIWWVSGDVYVGKVVLDSKENFNFGADDLFWVVNVGGAFNTPFRFGKEGEGWAADLYMSIGPSFFDLGGKKFWGGFLGGGLIAHTPVSFLALRADLKNFFYTLSNRGGSNFNGDMVLSLGATLKF